MSILLRLLAVAISILCAGWSRPRIVVETDIGGDRDDQESLIRLLLHSHELDIRAVICDRPREQLLLQADANAQNPDPRVAVDGVSMARYYVDNGYAPVVDNLRRHASTYPTAETVRSWLVAGYPGTTAGRDRLMAEVDAVPAGGILWYMNWGSNVVEHLGSPSTIESNLKRALERVRAERGDPGLREFLRKLRIVTLDGNTNRYGRLNTRLGDELNAFVRSESLHIETGWPAMDGGRWYHRFRALTQNAGGFDKRLDLSPEHGPLATLYHELGQKEGDSWCFVYLLPFGISDPLQPSWGGLAGRYAPRGDEPAGSPISTRGAPFYWNSQQDTWHGRKHRDLTAARFADAVQNAFRARLDWCTKSFADANHDPIPTLSVDAASVTMDVLKIDRVPGETVEATVVVHDPDAGDSHRFRWFVYPEAGTYPGELSLQVHGPSARLVIPADAAGHQLHVYVEVTDNGSRKGDRVPDLTRYCRLVVDVGASSPKPGGIAGRSCRP